MEDPESSPWLNDLEHFLGTKLEASILNHFGTSCTYDFPIFRTVPIKIATLKVPSHNEYSSPGTSIGTWMLPQK